MIEEPMMKFIASAMTSDDPEMVTLGKTIFIENNPTDLDIDKLNTAKGYPPIMFSLMEKITQETIQLTNNPDCNIL